MKQIIIALAILLSSCASTQSSDTEAASPETLPDFKAADQHGKEWSLESTKSKPLLIDFWATWCVPCLRSIPDLNAFHKKHGKKVNLLGASTDEKGWEVVKPAIKRFDIQYPILLASPEVAEAYGVSGYPFLVVVKDGKIVKRLLGRHSQADLEQKLAAFLK